MTKKMTGSKAYILIEFLLLCVAVPTVIITFRYAPFMFAFLWGATLYCVFIYRRHYKTSWSELWGWRAVRWRALKPILLRWILATIGMYLFMLWYDPDRLFTIIQNRPQIIAPLMILYPVLSALPQEFIFCSFFFARYARYFGRGIWMVLASALLFAYAHVLYINPVAPVLSLAGGLIFAQTYRQHKSLALVTIEHGLYGNAMFLIGLGWYFYSGAVHLR